MSYHPSPLRLCRYPDRFIHMGDFQRQRKLTGLLAEITTVQ